MCLAGLTNSFTKPMTSFENLLKLELCIRFSSFVRWFLCNVVVVTTSSVVVITVGLVSVVIVPAGITDVKDFI